MLAPGDAASTVIDVRRNQAGSAAGTTSQPPPPLGTVSGDTGTVSRVSNESTRRTGSLATFHGSFSPGGTEDAGQLAKNTKVGCRRSSHGYSWVWVSLGLGTHESSLVLTRRVPSSGSWSDVTPFKAVAAGGGSFVGDFPLPTRIARMAPGGPGRRVFPTKSICLWHYRLGGWWRGLRWRPLAWTKPLVRGLSSSPPLICCGS